MPKDNHPPAFRFYVDDFISDSAVDAMTNEEVGIYVRFLCKAWKESPVGTIPNDDKVLSNWAKCSPATWKKCRPGVLRAFVLGDDSRYHQKRMKLEWEKAVEYHNEKSKAGSKGAKNRWHSHDSANGKAIANDGISSSSSSSLSCSDSGDDVEDGAIDITLGEDARVRERARRISRLAGIDCRVSKDRELVAKAALLWDCGELSDDDIEQVIESFSRKKGPIESRAAWFHTCLDNRCKGRLNAMLATVIVPIGLMIMQPEASQ